MSCNHLGTRILLLSAVVLAVGLASPPARAGIVNVQSILATKAEEGFTGSITGSVDFRSGNSNRFLLSLAPSARYKRGDHLIIGVAKGDMLLTGSPCEDDPQEICYEVQDRKVFEHVRYRHVFTKRIIGEVFGQHEYNERKRLSLRALLGVGPRVQILDTERLQVGVGVAYMLEYETLQENFSDDNEGLNHRISSYATGSYELSDKLQLVETVYAQPLITGPSDIRLLNETQLVIKLSESLSLKTSLVVAYDSEPPVDDTGESDVEPTDVNINGAITYTF